MVALLWELSEPECEQIKDQLTLYSRDKRTKLAKFFVNSIFLPWHFQGFPFSATGTFQGMYFKTLWNRQRISLKIDFYIIL